MEPPGSIDGGGERMEPPDGIDGGKGENEAT